MNKMTISTCAGQRTDRKVKLGDVCDYSQDRIAVADLSLENYISTENMFSYKAGITTSSSFPDMSFVSKYQPNDVLVSNIRPYFKKIWQGNIVGGCSNDILIFRKKRKDRTVYEVFVLYFG